MATEMVATSVQLHADPVKRLQLALLARIINSAGDAFIACATDSGGDIEAMVRDANAHLQDLLATIPISAEFPPPNFDLLPCLTGLEGVRHG